MIVNVIFAVEAPQQGTFPPENPHQLPSIWGLVGRWRAPGERHQCSQEGSRDLDCLVGLDISGVDIGDDWWNSDPNWSYHFWGFPIQPIMIWSPNGDYIISLFLSEHWMCWWRVSLNKNASGEFTAVPSANPRKRKRRRRTTTRLEHLQQQSRTLF